MATELGIFSNKFISKYCVYIYCLIKILCWKVQSDYDLASLSNLKLRLMTEKSMFILPTFIQMLLRQFSILQGREQLFFPKKEFLKWHNNKGNLVKYY